MHLDPSPQQFSKKVTPRKCIISIFASAAIHPIDIKGILSIDHAISGISNVPYAIELNKNTLGILTSSPLFHFSYPQRPSGQKGSLHAKRRLHLARDYFPRTFLAPHIVIPRGSLTDRFTSAQ